jgi:hypothetical protein
MRMRVMRIIFFCLIVFLSLPELSIGGHALLNGIHAHAAGTWSVQHDYFTEAILLLGAG